MLSDEPQRRARVAYNVPLRVVRDAVAGISIASGTLRPNIPKEMHAGVEP